MDHDFYVIQRAVLDAQAKHYEFFLNSNSTIMDYVDLIDGKLTVLTFKNNLPQYIIDDILAYMKR